MDRLRFQVGVTLLDLNQRISQGEELSEQEQICLGSYEEGFGEPLLSIRCDRPLATGDVPLRVGEAAFFDTAACRESIFNRSSDACVMQTLTLSVPVDWFVPESGRPSVVFEGAELAYTNEGNLLQIQNAESAVSGRFECTVNLETGAANSSIANRDCDSIVVLVTEEIARLQER